jgi:hypothetical protein
MSFGTNVRVTNLVNNRAVIATVNGRIPASDSQNRVADISREAGDAIGMATTGLTEVRLEQLLPETAGAPVAATTPGPAPAPPPDPAAAQAAPPASQGPASSSREPNVETIQVFTQPPEYIMPPPAYGPPLSYADPLSLIILILLIVALLMLTAVLILLLCMRRLPWWPYAGTPWYYPTWVRRHRRYRKNRRV